VAAYYRSVFLSLHLSTAARTRRVWSKGGICESKPLERVAQNRWTRDPVITDDN